MISHIVSRPIEGTLYHDDTTNLLRNCPSRVV